jgi:hypothetical protein
MVNEPHRKTAAEEAQPTALQEESHGSALSPWLQLMLAEIRRKHEDLEQARAEQLRRADEANTA